MQPIGACRTCLVQIEGTRGFPASCSVPATDQWDGSLDRYFARGPQHPPWRPRADPWPWSVIKAMAFATTASSSIATKHHDLDRRALVGAGARGRWMTSNPVFNVAMARLHLMCGRCAQACQDGHQFIGAIDLLGSAGTAGRIGTFMDRPLVESVCTTCGQCLSVCPDRGHRGRRVPARERGPDGDDHLPLLRRRLRGQGAGRRERVHHRDARRPGQRVQRGDALRQRQVRLHVRPPRGPAYDAPRPKERAASVRRAWDEALDYVAEQIGASTEATSSPPCAPPRPPTRTGTSSRSSPGSIMQSNHIDHCTRLCHAPSVEAMLSGARQRCDQQLVHRLRGGWVPGDNRVRRQLEPSGGRLAG